MAERYPPDVSINFGNTMLLDKGGIDKSIVVDRDTIKWQQDTSALGNKLAIDTLFPSAETFSGINLITGDHSGGLPVESSVTTDLTDPDDLSQASWTKSGVAVSAFNGDDPYGEQNAQILTPDGAGDYIEQNTGVGVSGLGVACGIWLRAISGSHISQIECRKANGAETFTANIQVTEAWRYISALPQFGGGAGTNFVQRIIPDKDSNNPIAVRLPFAEVGVQQRRSPTESVTNADVTELDVSEVLRGDQGAWFCELMYPGDISNGVFNIAFIIQPIKAGGLAHRVYFSYSNDNKLKAQIRKNSPASFTEASVPIAGQDMDANVFYKFAGIWKADLFNLIKDGVVLDSDNSVSQIGDEVLPSDCRLYIGNSSTGLSQFDGIIRRMKFWKEPPPTTYLQELTS
jgi:hypothetical protein